MNRARLWGVILGSAVATLASAAFGWQQPAHLRGKPELQVAAGPQVRAQRLVVWDTPPPAMAIPWRQFVAIFGPQTRVSWDPVTNVPSRIFGAGLPAPGAMGSPATAARYARDLLRDHLALLAPGAAVSDFVLVTNDLSAGMRTVGFEQRFRGMAVIGGQISFRFKNDRLFVIGSEALPHVTAASHSHTLAPPIARAKAAQWLVTEDGVAPVHTDTQQVAGPFVLPLVHCESKRMLN